MSQQYVSALVIVLVAVSQLLGYQLDATELTNSITALVTGVAGIWIMIRRFKQGDITVVGTKK